MPRLFSRIFPILNYKKTNRAINLLTISDTFFFSGMELTSIVFSVFIVQQIPGANVSHLGIGGALFLLGILLTEPLFSEFYDSANNPVTSFYGYVIGNLLKAIGRFMFIFIDTINMFYVIYFLLGVVHSIEYPSFAKIFTRHMDKDTESRSWGYKDTFMSSGKIITALASGFLVLAFGYQAVFLLSALIMLIFGVIFPLIYKKDLIV